MRRTLPNSAQEGVNPSMKSPLNPARLIILLLFVGVLSGLIYTIGRSALYEPGTMHYYYITYAFFLTLLGRVVLKWTDEQCGKLATVLLSLIAGAYLVELVTAVTVGDPRDYATQAARQQIPFDDRTLYEVVKELRQQKVEAVQVISPFPYIKHGFVTAGGQELLPLGGISRKKSVHCNESGQYALFDADEYGFNNPLNSHGRPMDVALLGDSYTLGACVPPDQDVAGHLRKAGYQVLNLGYGGTGPLLQLGIAREYARAVKPPVLFYLYCEANDISDLLEEHDYPLLANYLDGGFSQHLRERQEEIDRQLNDYLEVQYRSLQPPEEKPMWRKLVQLKHLRAHLRVLSTTAYTPVPEPPPLFKQVLGKLRDEAAGWGGRVYAVYLPGLDRYKRPLVDHGEFRHRDRVLATFKEAGFPVIDLHPVFGSLPDPAAVFPLGIGPHYNSQGYALVAEAIRSRLAKEGMHPGKGVALLKEEEARKVLEAPAQVTVPPPLPAPMPLRKGEEGR